MSSRNHVHQEPGPCQDGSDQLAIAIREASIACPDERFSFHHAAEYVERGWSVIPLRGKRPAIPSWTEYQTRRPTQDEIRSWFSNSSGSTPPNIGIVTGSISGLVVVDCDTANSIHDKCTEDLRKAARAVRDSGRTIQVLRAWIQVSGGGTYGLAGENAFKDSPPASDAEET